MNILRLNQIKQLKLLNNKIKRRQWRRKNKQNNNQTINQMNDKDKLKKNIELIENKTSTIISTTIEQPSQENQYPLNESLKPLIKFTIFENKIKPRVQIYGPFNSGTNILVKLLNNIFDLQIPKEGSRRKWKHSLNINNFPNLFHICIIKNPFSWIQSVIKESYGIEYNKKIPIINQSVSMKGENNPRHFQTIFSLWYYYYQMYSVFSKKHPNFIFITYEQLLYDTDYLFEKLSNIFKLSIPNNYYDIKNKTMEKPAKPHGYCSDLTKALDKNKLEYLFSKYEKNDVLKFFNEVPTSKIHTEHQIIWNLDKWLTHFN